MDRRQFIKGTVAATGGLVAASGYVRPEMRSLGVAGALATVSGPPPDDGGMDNTSPARYGISGAPSWEAGLEYDPQTFVVSAVYAINLTGSDVKLTIYFVDGTSETHIVGQTSPEGNLYPVSGVRLEPTGEGGYTTTGLQGISVGG